MKTVTKDRISRVIMSVHKSPNKSAKRAALWLRLIKLREQTN